MILLSWLPVSRSERQINEAMQMKNILIPPASGGDYVDNAEADFIEIEINKIQTIIPRSL